MFCFDVSERHHAARADFYTHKRSVAQSSFYAWTPADTGHRYAKTDADAGKGQVKVDGRIYSYNDRPATPEEIAQTTADSMTVSYTRLFNSADGKKSLWKIFMDVLQKKCISRPGPLYVIKHAAIWTSPIEYTDPCKSCEPLSSRVRV